MFRSLFTNFTHAGSGFPGRGRGGRRAMARAASLAAITLVALGTLSSTAQAESVITNLTYYYDTQGRGNVPWVGGGDADVYSKVGRYTVVAVRTGYPYINPGGGSLDLQVEYEVQEGASNYTVLRKSDVVRFYVANGWTIARVLPDKGPVYWSRTYFGEDHFWHDESAPGSYFAYFSTRFDGSGRDDRGNAGLVAQIEIPVELVRN
jgi:hypothetical protein